ncbi:MAG: S9 family peptidase [Thermoanaerobaculia bacterium]|nr:S9 family peptidase [Thermoanaerobaculia bacterium]
MLAQRVLTARPGRKLVFPVAVVVALVVASLAVAQDRLTLRDVAQLRTVVEAEISPDGDQIAYLLAVPRSPGEGEDGGAWTELHVVESTSGDSRVYVGGEVDVSKVAWHPDGSAISFLTKRGDDETRSLYSIPIDGGEARRVLTHATDISSYEWSPGGDRIAFLASEEKPERQEKLAEKGFKAEIYEEQLLDVEVWTATIEDGGVVGEPRLVGLEGSASELHFAPDGEHLVVALAPTSHIDDHYMKRRVHLVDAASGEMVAKIDNPGKLGKVAVSPDGETIALLGGADPHDPGQNRLLVAPRSGGAPTELLPGYEGDFVDFAFESPNSILFVAHEGTEAKIGSMTIDVGAIEGAAAAQPSYRELVPAGGPIFESLSLSRDGTTAAFLADSPLHPTEVYRLAEGDAAPARITDSNPWLGERRLAPQETVTYEARDGLEVEGLLIRPLDEEPGKRYPLILVVHGGPESHYSDGWLTRYSTPGQVAAAEGYAVFYPNYRGSTGRGVAYSKLHQADYAGGEFDDLVDGVKHLVGTGLVDEARVGITGGSYGGFASAWGATALTEHFAAAVMFVGISDQVSKFGTTDIPNEMFMVHGRKYPWDDWDWYRERSPIYHTPGARTPILILHGKEDTRVHPSQSMELYRYLKVLGNVPVRLVFYPGEGHGNRNAAARYDYSLRLMRWMDHYLKGPGGEPPPPELDYPGVEIEESGKAEDTAS